MPSNKPKTIIANWKMNPVSFGEAESLLKTIKKGIKKSNNLKIIICPPAVYLSKIKANASFDLGIQNIFWEDKGAYTGEISAKMAKNLGVNYIRGRPSSVYENPDKSITIRYKDTITGKIEESNVDMLVLSTAIKPNEDNKRLGEALGIEVDENGFFKQDSLLTDPIQSSRKGIFLAGCIQGPKDIPDSVSMASGAAAKAVAPIKDREKHPVRSPLTCPQGEPSPLPAAPLLQILMRLPAERHRG